MSTHPVHRRTPSPADWRALGAGLAGEVVLPDSPAYDTLRRPAIARYHHVRPQAVVRCAAAADAVETLAFTRRHGLPTAVRSGGHCFAGRSSTTGVVIDVTPMGQVSVDGAVAEVGAGARLGQLYDTLAEHGRTIAAGCGTSVGIAGLTLGGGIGVLGRAHGLTCDQLLAAEVVLPDGRVVVCDDHHHAEVFWALRGAGAVGFGVVTRLVFATLRPPAMTSFRLTWAHSDATRVLDAWQAWAPSAPDGVAASLHVTASGHLAEPPVVAVSGTVAGGEHEAARQLSELVARVGSDPASADTLHGPHGDAKRHLAALDAGDSGDATGSALSRSAFFARVLPAAASSALVRHLVTSRNPGEGRELDFSPLGGAYNRRRPDATAFVHRRDRFLLKHSVVAGAGAEAGARRWLERSAALVRPWDTGRIYPNFPDPELRDPELAYYGSNLSRLRRIRSALAGGGG